MKLRTYAYHRKQSFLTSALAELPSVPRIEVDAGLADLCDSLLLVDEPVEGVTRVTPMQREGEP